MLDDNVLFEIPAKTLEEPPQDDTNDNPKKLMIEEPLYLIFNVALSTAWGAVPPNAGEQCEGDGTDPKVNRICADFPMHMRIDYIRVWQSKQMKIGCDPASHPTRAFIQDNIADYTDALNPMIAVAGGATCRNNDDCTIDRLSGVAFRSGECRSRRCHCFSPESWGGPRCTTAIGSSALSGFGPSFSTAAGVFGTTLALAVGIWYYRRHGGRSSAVKETEMQDLGSRTRNE